MYVYSLSLMFRMWNLPHYRNKDFQTDLLKNLRNVAIPGTGIPLSWFCIHKSLVVVFLWVIYPLLSFLSALLHAYPFKAISLSHAFSTQLLCPEDWFSLWQLNCRIASFHALLTHSSSYQIENKWEFLQQGAQLHPPVSVSPFNTQDSAIVVKDRNEEGGMGIYMFGNAVHGGQWIIQPKLENSREIAKFLPDPAPLSTFRVMTMSKVFCAGKQATADSIVCLSATFRAGLKNASTDHKSVLFPFNLSTGEFELGTSNAHWYKLGLSGIQDLFGGRAKLVSERNLTHHPDSQVKVAGERLDMDLVKLIKDASMDAHLRLAPDVFIIGWDVALTDKGCFLLEANLSCNFFRADFNRDLYFESIHALFQKLETYSQP